MIDVNTPASVKVQAAEAIFNHAAKAIEIEDIDARLSAVEAATGWGSTTMKAVIRRLCRLEERVSPADVVAPGWVAVMRESRRRRAEAEGRPYVEPEPLVVDDPNDWASVMRAHRARRAADSQRISQ